MPTPLQQTIAEMFNVSGVAVRDLPEQHHVIVTGKCPICGEPWSLILDMDAFYRWDDYRLPIQAAFPTLSADHRERLISQVCCL